MENRTCDRFIGGVRMFVYVLFVPSLESVIIHHSVPGLPRPLNCSKAIYSAYHTGLLVYLSVGTVTKVHPAHERPA